MNRHDQAGSSQPTSAQHSDAKIKEVPIAHTLTLQAIRPVTHDTQELTFERPDGFEFRPGQATDFALDKDEWRDEKRPFTMASLPDADKLQFVIKSYPDHDGVTEQIGQMQPGAKVIIEEPWGAIEDRGPGTILAAGAGITPFIAILRARLADKGTLDGYRLIFSNSCEKDIILRDELTAMDGLETRFVLSDEEVEGLHHGKINGDLLDQLGIDAESTFYLCGPPEFEDDVASALKERGVDEDNIVREED
ncbi:FAD-binding oxidoreductase [Qipengyuania sp. S6317L1]|uniref:FAD-binding oxidoreductase n=1 Tax=Qipengyuania sp. S6317L1 TaxID=2926410 RepID=UPI001FF3A4E6|nr:FAD-binding oxidoreductase [Qipengyuania sp. S6317L1]MCK0098721.1 FAD-binding oxidoreductase [Qipengyuania sp. S6317L1]